MSTTGITTYYHKRDGQLSLSCLERLDGLYYLNGDRYIIDETIKSYTRLAPHERDDTTQRIILIALSCLTGIGLIVYAIVLIRRCYCHYQLRSLQESVNTPEQISLLPQPQQEVVQTTEKTHVVVEQTPLKQEPVQTTAEKEEPQEKQEKASIPDRLSMPWDKMVQGWDKMRAREQESVDLFNASVEAAAAKGPAEKAILMLDLEFRDEFSDARKRVMNASKSKDPEKIQLAITAFVDIMRRYSQRYTEACKKHESLLNSVRGKALFERIHEQIYETMREIQYQFISIEQPQKHTLKMWRDLIMKCSAFLPEGAIAPLDAFSTALCERHSGEPEYIAWSGGYRALQNYYQQIRACYSIIHTNASEQEIHSYAKGQLARFLARVTERIDDYNDYKNKDKIIQHLAKCSDPNDPIRQTVRIGEYLPHFSNPQAAEIETFLNEVLA